MTHSIPRLSTRDWRDRASRLAAWRPSATNRDRGTRRSSIAHIDLRLASFASKRCAPSIGAPHQPKRAPNVQSLQSRHLDWIVPSPARAPESDPFARSADLDAALRVLMTRDTPGLQAHVEQRLVHNAYELCDRNQVRTARLLGISRNVLRAQLIRFGYLTRTGIRRATRPPQQPAQESSAPAGD
jgi:hypothetical protein